MSQLTEHPTRIATSPGLEQSGAVTSWYRGSIPRWRQQYDSKDVSRVRFIKSAQRIGFKLDEIAQLLRLDDGTHCAGAREIAEHKLVDVRLRLSDLRNIEASLSDLVRRCKSGRGKVTCPLIASLHATELQ